MSRRITATEKRIVGARQDWKCAACFRTLTATYETDHVIPLHMNGSDHISNLSALCVSCHAKKTQNERLERFAPMPTTGPVEYVSDTREDVATPDGRLHKCTTCGLLRPITSVWESHRCPGPGMSVHLVSNLRKFSYDPRAKVVSNLI